MRELTAEHEYLQATKISWKDDAKNLTKVHPRVTHDEDEEPSEGGSFFNFFEIAEDPFDVSPISGVQARLTATDRR